MVQVSPKYTPRYRGPRRGPATNYVNEDLNRLAERAKRAKDAAENQKAGTALGIAAQQKDEEDAALKSTTATPHVVVDQKSQFSLARWIVGSTGKALWKGYGPGIKAAGRGVAAAAGFTKDAIADFYTDFDSKEEIAAMDAAAAARDRMEKQIARGEVDPRFRPATPEEQEQYDAWARYRDEFSKTASGAYPESPVRQGYLMPSGERVQPGVTGALQSTFDTLQQNAAMTVAMALTTPGISDVAKIFGTENFDLGVEAMEDTAAKLRSMGVRPDEAAWLAYHSNDLPKFVKGALEFGLDPLNLLPGIGWGGSIARGVKIAAALRAGTKGGALRLAATESPDIMTRRAAQEITGTSELEKVAKGIDASPIDEADALSKGASPDAINEANQRGLDAATSMVELMEKSPTLPVDDRYITAAIAIRGTSEEGFIAKVIDNIPGLQKTREMERLLQTPEGMRVAVAQVASDGLRNELSIYQAKNLKIVMDDLDNVFKSLEGELKPMAGGKVDVVRNSVGQDIEGFIGHGTMLDIMERPSAYNLNDAQRAAIKALNDLNHEVIDVVNPFLKHRKINKVEVQEGAAYIPHRDLARNTDISGVVQAALHEQRRAFGKPRKYQTYNDRWAAAKQAQDEAIPTPPVTPGMEMLAPRTIISDGADIREFVKANPDKELWFHGGSKLFGPEEGYAQAGVLEEGFLTRHIDEAIDYARDAARKGEPGEGFIHVIDISQAKVGPSHWPGIPDNVELLAPVRPIKSFDVIKEVFGEAAPPPTAAIPAPGLKPAVLPEPDLNLRNLLNKNMQVKTESAVDELFQRASAGLSKADVIERISPLLGKRIKNWRVRLKGLQKSLKGIDDIAEEGQKSLYDEIEDIVDVDDLTIMKGLDDPTISPLAIGEALPKALNIADLNRLGNRLNAVAGRGLHNAAVTRRMRKLAEELRGLQDEWASAGKAIDEGRTTFVPAKAGGRTFGYYDEASAKIINRIHSYTEGRFARGWMAIKETVFGGDFSPLLLNVSTGFISHPILVGKQVWRAFNFKGEGMGGIRKYFSTRALLQDIAADRAWWDDWFLYGGRGLRTPDEFGGGLLRQIPVGQYLKGIRVKKQLDVGTWFATWNDTVFSMVERGGKNIFKEQAQNYMEQGFPEHIAKAIAAQEASAAFLLPTGGKLGSSEFARKFGSKMITSVTFLKRPVESVEQAMSGLAKLAQGIAITAKEKGAIRRIMTIYGNVSIVSFITTGIAAHRLGRDPMKAALATLDPNSPSYMKLVLPRELGGFSIPLAAPYRAIFKLMAPRPITKDGPPIPFGGLRDFITGRIHPAARTAVEGSQLIAAPLTGAPAREIYSGEQILSEDSPAWQNLLETLAWGSEQVLPLTAGEIAEGLRKRRPIGEIGERTVWQFLGTNAYGESPYRQRNEIAMQYAETYLSEEEAKEVRGFYNLPDRLKKMIEAAEPELVAAIMDENERMAKFGDVRAQKMVAADQLKQRHVFLQESEDEKLRMGLLSPLDWKVQRRGRKAALSNERDGIYTTEVNTDDPRNPTDFYYKQMEILKEKYLSMTNDAWDELDRWILQQSLPDQKYLEENTGLGPYTATEQAYNRSMQYIDKTAWFRVWENLVENNPAVSDLYNEWKRLPTRSDQAEFERNNPALQAAMERARLARNLIRQKDRTADAIVGYWWGRGGWQQRYNIGKQGSEIAAYLTQNRYGPAR
jgi:hypothetical protein